MIRNTNVSVMNFLNEITDAYPNSISMAAGRPGRRLLEAINEESVNHWVSIYSRHFPSSNIWQYGRTAGIIHELIAEQIIRDDRVPSAGERLIVTAGCQEALMLCISELCSRVGDVLLVRNPTYIGVTGAAQFAGVEVRALSNNVIGLHSQIEQAIAELATEGKRARAIYLVPDFDNPTGEVLSYNERKNVLAACDKNRLIVLEDNPYGMYRYDGVNVAPMASIDNVGCVIYLSTYSKTVAPGLRMGAATLPERLFGDRKASAKLYHSLVARKSFFTVNTSTLCQAILGGLLLENDCTLQNWVRPAIDECRHNRDAMLHQLAKSFDDEEEAVSWNHPEGGFFLSLNVPFPFDAEAVAECATSEGVIVMPMAFFAFDSSQDSRVRLAFSALEEEHITAGIAAFSRYLQRRVRQHR